MGFPSFAKFHVLRFARKRNTPPVSIALTIGNFDGIHKGHIVLLERLISVSREECLVPTVMLFEPQTHEFFCRRANQAMQLRITSLSEKIEILRGLGIGQVLIVDFNERFAALDPSNFIRQLVMEYQMRHLIIGDDFHFGRDKGGNAELLRSLAEELGFSLSHLATQHTDQQDHGGESAGTALRVSSSLIRNALGKQQLSFVNKMLYVPYHFTGRVVHGSTRGRTIGFPTANIQCVKGCLLRGVLWHLVNKAKLLLS